ncbi:uncharacterized protein LOC123206597 [Mangifera indica]|uniref:uncharacterized protein LOC123206597 n=1 Tax=Mangifera indica TaxID=29780 RepID=UPI001CFBC6F0|nr:uncharacterized protein LOC123206597 [Mangifera indica]
MSSCWKPRKYRAIFVSACADMMMEVSKREETGTVLDPDVDTYTKVSSAYLSCLYQVYCSIRSCYMYEIFMTWTCVTTSLGTVLRSRGRIERRLLRFLSRTLRFLHLSVKIFSRRLFSSSLLITLGDYTTILFNWYVML